MRTSLSFIAAAGLVVLTGCTVKNTEAPALSGPSEFATGITVQAVPDSILQDGSSQAAVVIDAHGPDGRPARGLVLRAETFVDGDAVDYGTLSGKTVVTGDDGKARLTYTSPPPPVESTGTGTIITIRVTPVGGDFRGEIGRQVDVKLIPPGTILPPNGAPVPSFVVTPQPVTTKTPANFDATGTTDEGVRCGSRCSFAWSFGDSTSGAGETIQHEYRTSGSYTVTLTVTDQRGIAATLSRNIFVQTVAGPVADFSFSPTTPTAGQDVFFTAEKSKAAEGRSIVSYDWNFGSGRTGSGVTISKGYNTPGTYIVTLTVTDNAGEKGVSEKTLTVSPVAPGVGPTAVLTFSPTSPTTSTSVFFDGSGSTGKGITTYRFTWGDNSADAVGSSSTANHTFGSAGTYIVRLTVTDADGLNGTTTQNVVVTNPGGGPTAVLTFSPTSPTTTTAVFFDGTASTTTTPATISTYRFTWGDNTADTVITAPTAATTTHTFTVAGTYTVRLTVTDNQARTGTVTKDVVVTTPTPGTGPVARLSFSPSSPTTSTVVSFDGRASTAQSPATIVSYRFAWGDGSADTTNATGTATHTFTVAGTYVVQLIVTDSSVPARTGTTTQSVPVTATDPGTGPVPVFTFSPIDPVAASPIFFDAAQSFGPAAITKYVFTWGDNTSDTTILAPTTSTTHTFFVPGTYVVRLTVTDSALRVASTTRNVTVIAAAPTAVLTVSPGPYAILTNITFDGVLSTPAPGTPGVPIVTYRFTWGDATADTVVVAPITSAIHQFNTSGLKTVRLTVTDSAGRTGTITTSITIP